MTVKICHRCGVELDEVHFIAPDWNGQMYPEGTFIPYLCSSCWVKADEETRLGRLKSKEIKWVTTQNTV